MSYMSNTTMSNVENWLESVDFGVNKMINLVHSHSEIVDDPNIDRNVRDVDLCVHMTEEGSNSNNIYYIDHSLSDNASIGSLSPSPNLNNQSYYVDNIVDINYSGSACKQLTLCSNETNAFLFQKDPLLDAVVVRVPLSTSDTDDTSETLSSYYNVDNITESFKDLSTKSKLKTTILNRCMAEGKDIQKMMLECHELSKVEIMPSALEMAKENDRKERNRLSAKRSRDSKKAGYDEIKKKHEALRSKNEEEKKAVQDLEKKVRTLEDFINTFDLHPRKDIVNTFDLHPHKNQENAPVAIYDTNKLAQISSDDFAINDSAVENSLPATISQCEHDISLADYSENETHPLDPEIILKILQALDTSNSQPNECLSDINNGQKEMILSETFELPSNVELSQEQFMVHSQQMEPMPTPEPSDEQSVINLHSNKVYTDISLSKKHFFIPLSQPMEPQAMMEINQEQPIPNAQVMAPQTAIQPFHKFQRNEAELNRKQSLSYPLITNHQCSENDAVVPSQFDIVEQHYSQNGALVNSNDYCNSYPIEIRTSETIDMSRYDTGNLFCIEIRNVSIPSSVPSAPETKSFTPNTPVDCKLINSQATIKSKASLDVWRVDTSTNDDELSDLTSSFLDEPLVKKRKINNAT